MCLYLRVKKRARPFCQSTLQRLVNIAYFCGLLRGSVLNSNQALKRAIEALLFAKLRGRKRISLDWFIFLCRIPKLGLSVIAGSADIAKQISKAAVWHVALVAAVCKSWSLL